VSGFLKQPLVPVLFIIDSRSHVQAGYNLPSCLPIYLRATYQVIEIRASETEPEAVPKCGTCASGIRP
jgi:hypothetical protein